MTTPTPDLRWDDAIRSFHHTGPDGDAALADAHPDLTASIRQLAPGQACVVAGVPVARQGDGNWRAGDDRNLASPWIVVQSVRSAIVR